jgi:hypothetical protein
MLVVFVGTDDEIGHLGHGTVGNDATLEADRTQRTRIGTKASRMMAGEAMVNGFLMPATFSAFTSFSS